MTTLVPVYDIEERYRILWELLLERTPEQSISHKGMPTFENHIRFIQTMPYTTWDFIRVKGEIVGQIYLTHQREIGISIFNCRQGKGYGKRAIEILIQRYPGRFLANINPSNSPSAKLFTGMGFKKIQETFEL